MVEQKVALNLVKKAVQKYKDDNLDYPAIDISKRYYKRYDLNVLTNELNSLNFKLIDKASAPEPFNQDKNAKKYWLVFQPISN